MNDSNPNTNRQIAVGMMVGVSLVHLLIVAYPYFVMIAWIDYGYGLRPIADGTIVPPLLSIIPAVCIARMAHQSHWSRGGIIGATLLSAITYPLWSMFLGFGQSNGAAGYWVGPIFYASVMVAVMLLRSKRTAA